MTKEPKLAELRRICEVAKDYGYGGTSDFVNTFSPSTVLKLLDKIERYEKALLTIENYRPSQDWPTDDDLESAQLIAKEALKEG